MKKQKKIGDWKVDILGKLFTIRWGKPAPENNGECESSKCLITIDDELHLEQQKDTLLHECVHALDHEMEAKMSERNVKLIATALLHFLRANPHIARWLMER